MALSLTARKLVPCLSLQASLARHSESAHPVLPFVPDFSRQLRFRWPATFQKHRGQTRHSFSQEAASARRGVVQAVVAGEVIDIQAESVVTQVETEAAQKPKTIDLACPICYGPIERRGPEGFSRAAVDASRFECPRCKRSFPGKQGYADLTVLEGAQEYADFLPPGTQIFRNPLVSFVYERGWRQGFAQAGFPGVDQEFVMAQRYLEPAAGGVLLDVSCGSGLFTRRFASSGKYSAVIGSDFSESMLVQTRDFIRQDRTLDDANLALVRADVGRLPFETGSIDGVHAGAALHCWPSPSSAVAEISRVLRPGGVFVASTFLAPRAPIPSPLARQARQTFGPNSAYRQWKEDELRDLARACGLVDFCCTRNRQFIILSVRKAD
ncbi:S-adenosyl-L-methionine-dependent methyltransferases superfamily protein [Klebsormidium nitens]|uniref:S-adenosyl-L-methionine-dependent methyltransferases superfamily protein n=1 Tax=Klebsormidium nitens TaxID=105231 RepID=A0A1Y1HVB0_KLENI|nr:S-adenosyl-L-methionine-dependent methyltransferases superfamily protein [Klebsormidium nitens]|eukprot:GAQ80477.1 S-adenosyl-L-methionine-dependent methyltransferases superfamily protein [Klebsormidium nitens]